MTEYTTLDFFGYSNDQKEVLSLLRQSRILKDKKICLMAAPSFVVDFDFHTFVPLMKALGFDKVTELTFGARTTNREYEKYIKKNIGKQEKFISTVCPASVEFVKKSFPELKKFLLPIDSPMGAMAKICKKNFPKHKIVFLAPCNAKKIEASKLLNKKGEKLIDAVVTFTEMKQIVAKEKPLIKIQNGHNSSGFDCFHNDYTKIYPLAGGLCGTLHHKDLLKENEIAICDGAAEFKQFFEKNKEKVFFDVLFCKGGCIGGAGVSSKLPIFLRKKKVMDYSNFAKKENMNGKQGLDKYTKGISFSKEI